MNVAGPLGLALIVWLTVPAMMVTGPQEQLPYHPTERQRSSVMTTVQVNPVQIGLVLPRDRVHFPNLFIVASFTTIAGRYRHNPLDRRLVFGGPGLRLVAHLAIPMSFSAQDQTSRSLDLWLVQPLERGEYVIVATAAGLLRGAAVHAESVPRTVVIR